MSVVLKTCRKCGSEFSGRACRMCDRARAKAWYRANREKAVAGARARRAANPEKSRASAKAWRDANADRKRLTDKAWRDANTDRARTNRKRGQLRRLYDLTLDRYAEMLASQGGACAVCRSTPKPGTSLCVDHNHQTGEVRELLCVRCNRQVGIHENTIASAIRAYLKKHGGVV